MINIGISKLYDIWNYFSIPEIFIYDDQDIFIPDDRPIKNDNILDLSSQIDIWSYVSEFVERDKDKCHLMMSCKNFSKCRFYFRERINIKKIIDKKWFNHFTNILINGRTILPLSVSHLTFGVSWNDSLENFIPSTVKHITFKYLQMQTGNFIPSLVTHITFDQKSSHNLNNFLSKSVTHLRFGHYFDQPVNYIPSTVTHLTFGHYFNHSVKGIIPSSVTHLTFDKCFCQSIEGCIPSSVVQLNFNNYNLPITKYLPSSKIKIINKGMRDMFDF